MIDVVSTNKTDFFRESNHFDFMRSHVLPGLTKSSSLISFWSAGCSSGEEVYTICMVVDDYMRNRREVQYNVIGSDISTEVLHTAANAIYAEERVAGLPLELRKRYFLKSKDPSRKQVRMVPDLRNRTRFIRLNFMDNKYSQIPVGHDVIFCRNVLIYFDKYTQEAVIKRLCNHLRPGGYFFLGHSESIMGMEVPLKQIKPTIFQKV